MYKSQMKPIVLASFLLSNQVFAHNFNGELEVTVFDYFDQKKSETLYQLHEGKEVYNLDLPTSINKSQLLTGRKVIIEGQEIQGLKNEKRIKVESIELSPEESRAPAVSTRNIVSFLLNFTDKKTTTTVKKADVDGILYTRSNSMQALYDASSDNQVKFVRDTNNDGSPDIYVINLNYEIGDSCNYSQWSSDAVTAAASFGIDVSLYRHRMFVLPTNVGCSWGGLGNVGCGTSCNTWIRSYPTSLPYAFLVYSHEIGHNLGLNHAATDTNNDGVTEKEYGDSSTVMGAGDYREMNAPERDLMKWYDSYPNQLSTITSSSQHSIYPLEEVTPNTSRLKVLKFKRSASSTYYVSYRKNLGIFGMGSDYSNKINIHYTKAGNTHSYFVKALTAGQSFVDTNNGVTIVANQAGGDTATVTIKFTK